MLQLSGFIGDLHRQGLGLQAEAVAGLEQGWVALIANLPSSSRTQSLRFGLAVAPLRGWG